MSNPQPLQDLLTLPNLRAWLAGRPAGETYVQGDPCGCPVAKYLQGSGYDTVLVRSNYLMLNQTSGPVNLPKAVCEFVVKFDGLKDAAEMSRCTYPPNAAIQIIDTITGEAR